MGPVGLVILGGVLILAILVAAAVLFKNSDIDFPFFD